ncbi:pheromone a factor receptor [[Candida] anglica]|uniref:Pheromone a factor receptor n=1 Tax=[Candida] anglica TaxID=148631 RepID=A0ABP0EHT8_9ASCO
MSDSTFGNCLAAFSCLGLVILIPPFIWHIKSRNVPAVLLIFWIAFSNLKGFINALIWSGEDFETNWDGKIYCDIVTRLDVGSYIGKLCALAAISLNLFMVLRGSTTFLGNGRKRLIINLCICLISPIILMILDFFVDSYRYGIVRYMGCGVANATTYVALILLSIWKLLWGFVTIVFASLTLYTYYKKRKDVSDLLRCTNSGLTSKKYLRLLVFSTLMILCLAPLTIYLFVDDSHNFTGSYNWSYIHWEGWSTVIPRADFGYHVTYPEWINIVLSIITFMVFGLGSEAMKMYKSFLVSTGLFKSVIAKHDSKKQAEYEEKLAKLSQTRTVKKQDTEQSEDTAMGDLDFEFKDLVNDFTASEYGDTIGEYDLEQQEKSVPGVSYSYEVTKLV